jgi:hypothetical protein
VSWPALPTVITSTATQAGEPPGRWWALGRPRWVSPPGQVVEREPYNAVYQQLDLRTGEKPGRCRGNYVKFTDHMTRLRAAGRMPRLSA